MKMSTIDTGRGCHVRVFEAGAGAPLVYLHGAGGIFDDDPFVAALAERHRVFAPELPGYGESTGEDLLEDMLDFTLHGWDVVAGLGLERPHLVGHSMGGMIAAEMACLAPRDVAKLVLISPAGLWMDDHPIPDIFGVTPFELPPLLFHDTTKASLLAGGVDFSDDDALTEFMVGNARRLGMAGKILFPIPNRRLSKRLYRLQAETLVVWGEEDRLIPPVYADKWASSIVGAKIEWIDEAGHMAPFEQTGAVANAVGAFLG